MIFDRLTILGQTIPGQVQTPGDGSSYSFPEQASTFAEKTDFLYHSIFWISLFFFLIIIIPMCYFVVKYRRREGVPSEPSPSHNTPLELAWTIIPTIFLVWMFFEGATAFMNMRNARDDATEILVRGKQWAWSFTYPNGETTDTLHLALNKPVRFRMMSEDVLHSFFIPEFRQKWDVVPGRYTTTWVVPTRTSTAEDPFRLYCTEYCGDSHSLMKSDVIVHAKTWEEIIEEYVTYDYESGLPSENGEHVYKVLGCVGCHSADGTNKVGPSFKGNWKTQQQVTLGSDSKETVQVTIDENYVRESILEPQKKIRAGFQPQMPNLFNGRQLSEQEIDWVIAYMKHLNGDDSPLATAGKGEAADGDEATDEESADEESAGEESTDEDAAAEKTEDKTDEPAKTE